MIGVHLTGVHLIGVYLTGVHLIGVHFMGAYLTGERVMGMHLMGVCLSMDPKGGSTLGAVFGAKSSAKSVTDLWSAMIGKGPS